MRRINILFDERNLLQIRTPDSEFQTEFLRFCVGIIRIPIAMYHFYAAGPTVGGSPRRMPSAPPKRRRNRPRGITQRRREHGGGGTALANRFACEVAALIRVYEVLSGA